MQRVNRASNRGIETPKLLIMGIVFALSLTAVAAQGMLREEDYTSSAKCGECHDQIYAQWQRSIHSQSLKDPVYRAVFEKVMEASNGEQKVFCLSCHAPIASITGSTLRMTLPLDWDQAFSPVASEGVTCDFCHTISGNENRGRGVAVAAFVYPHKGQSKTKYGPDADAQNQDHPVEKSDFLTSPEFCATCHRFMHPLSSIEIQNTYKEWQQSGYAQRGTRCQDCHMPAYPGKNAKNGKDREQVNAHTFAGGHTSMVQNAVDLELSARLDPSTSLLSVSASITNSGAGHSIPTGVPGMREMWLEVKVVDGGRVLASQRFPYGLRLIQKSGALAGPWEEFDHLEDRRIGPGESRVSEFEVPLGATNNPVRVEAAFYMRLVAAGLTDKLGLETYEPILVKDDEVTVRRP